LGTNERSARELLESQKGGVLKEKEKEKGRSRRNGKGNYTKRTTDLGKRKKDGKKWPRFKPDSLLWERRRYPQYQEGG